MGCCTSKHTQKWPDPKSVPRVPNKNEIVKVLIYEVYDGDTCSILMPFGGEFININIRVKGIDAPELKVKENYQLKNLEEQAGIVVRDYVSSLIKGKELNICIYKWDKYGGRVVADIFLDNNQTITEHLLEKGYGVPYNGGKKEEWTRKKLNHIIKN